MVTETYVGRDLTINVGTVVRNLGERIGLAPPKLGAWGLIGREDELNKLHNAVRRSQEQGTGPTEIALSGLGGLGKTALALGYLAAHGGDYELVAWIDAENPDLIPAQYRQLVRNVTGADLSEFDAVSAGRALLAEKKWLVVFDNAHRPNDAHRYMPVGTGCALVTTRNLNWSANRENVVEVTTLPSRVVTEWIAETVPNSDPTAVAGIVDHLDGLPLAIVQAIAYITSRPGETVESYLGKLNSKRSRYEVLAEKQPADYPASVATTWDVAMETLSEELPTSVELLRYIAYTSPGQMPIGVIGELMDGSDVPSALDGLLAYGMVRASSSYISVHRLVQAITRWALTNAEETQYVKDWAEHLAAAAPDPMNPNNADWYSDTAEHVLSLCVNASNLDLSSARLARIAHNAATVLADQGAENTALSILEQLVSLNEREFGRDSLEVASKLANMGIVHRRLAHFDDALHYLLRALQIEIDELGAAHTQTALTLGAIAHVYEERGHYDDARNYLERALAIERSELGEGHARTASTMMHIARVRMAAGDGQAAVRISERSLSVLESVFGPGDARLAPTLSVLGHAHLEVESLPRAVATFERCLALVERAYSADDPRVASALDGLAQARSAQGDTSAAIGLLDRSLTITRSVYGDLHPQTAGVKVNLAGAKADMGSPEQAIVLYEEALQVLESTYGHDHPNVARVLHDLSQAKASEGTRESLEEAFRLASDSLAIFELVLGDRGSHLTRGLQNLASLSDRLGERTQALTYYLRLVAVYRETFGPADEATLSLQRFIETYED